MFPSDDINDYAHVQITESLHIADHVLWRCPECPECGQPHVVSAQVTGIRVNSITRIEVRVDSECLHGQYWADPDHLARDVISLLGTILS